MRFRARSAVLVVLALIALASAGAFLIYGGDGGTDGTAPSADAIAPNGSAPGGPAGPNGPEAIAGAGDAIPLEGTGSQTAPATAAKPSSKIQSSLSELAAAQIQSGPEAASEFAAAHSLTFRDGMVKVVVETVAGADASLSDVISASGGVVETSYNGLVQARVPVGSLEQLSASRSVGFVREPRKPSTFTTTEGVADIGASSWHSAGQNGAGVKIAVLDPGFAGYNALVASGELPAGVIVQSFSGDITGGGQEHGAACAEIVYDVAPGAQLYLVNFDTDVELGNAVDYLIAQNVDVISASWGFYGTFRGDGSGGINDIVQRASAAGILWVNASGNAGRAHWSGPFTDTNADSWHEFSGGDLGNDITASAGSNIDFYLTWNRWPVTDQDYDMYLVWSGNPSQPVAAGENWQNGSQPPAEEIHYTVPPGKGGTYYVTITKFSATGDAVFQLYTYPNDFQYQVAAGSLGGQPTDSAHAMVVGAVAVGTTTLENFSSRGPTTDGRIKPDIAGPDRVSTSTYGVHGFWGTSAAAPHAAGAAALMKDAAPSYTAAEIQTALESRATDLGDAGKDNLFGSGKLLMGALPDSTPPLVTSVEPSGLVTEASATVVVYYMDSGSGIDTSSVQVTLDGVPLAGCTVTTAQASCPVSGLVDGAHSIGGSVKDNSGNASPISGSFNVNLSCGKPLLTLSAPTALWASYADYVSQELTANYPLCNVGGIDARNLKLVGAVNTNSALLATTVPMAIGNLNAGGGTPTCTTISVRYHVPAGVSSFRSTLYVTSEDICGVVYAYPSQYLDV